MTKHIRLNYRVTTSLGNRPLGIRVPRGLAMLRALRLRLAAEKHPHLYQEEFRFSK